MLFIDNYFFEMIKIPFSNIFLKMLIHFFKLTPILHLPLAARSHSLICMNAKTPKID